MPCEMMELLACTRESYDITKKYFVRMNTATAVGTVYPKLYADWVKLMIREGSGLFRLYTLVVHMLFDDDMRDELFEGEKQENVIAFVGQLQDTIYNVFLGRMTDGSTLTKADVAQTEHQQIARIVLSMQEYYIHM